MSRGGGQINYREEEKKILDSILGKDVYDNRIRPSGLNGTGKCLSYVFLKLAYFLTPNISDLLQSVPQI